LKVKDKNIHKKEAQKAGGTMLIEAKLDFKERSITRNKMECFKLIMGLVHQEDTTIISMYVPNN
jgi:hypothetical protein